jgi:Phosphoglycerate dehydrogenase and related dehydrogenases
MSTQPSAVPSGTLKSVKGRVLLTAHGMNADHWRRMLSQDGRNVVLEPSGEVDPTIDYAVLWRYPHGLLRRLPNLKIIFSAGAGVDHIMSDPDVHDLHANVPIVRVVAPNLTQHMAEYVVWRVMDHHRQGIAYRQLQAQSVWESLSQPTASEVTVGIMGLGALGRAAAEKLLAIGFRVAGWSRTPRDVPGVESYTGEDGLTPFLNRTDILVILLPLTPATEGMVNYSVLARLRQNGPLGGPCLINASRGRVHREADILRALDEGILKEASLDVFEREPLPEESPIWQHPRIVVTPHEAAASDPDHLAPLMLTQMEAYERGEPLSNLVDREWGY